MRKLPASFSHLSIPTVTKTYKNFVSTVAFEKKRNTIPSWQSIWLYLEAYLNIVRICDFHGLL